MIIKDIKLSNFRCHKEYGLDFDTHTTQILGENGWGKTSVLEAIYLAVQGKSFKAVDREILRRGAEFYRVELSFLNGEKTTVVYDEGIAKKSFLITDKKWARLPKKNRYPVVLFEPADLSLITSSPTRRRDYFDRFLAQLFDEYNHSLSQYNKALKQRNELLKKEYVRQENLFPWNILLARYGVKIRMMRARLVANLNDSLTGVYRGIAENRDEVALKYDSYTGEALESEYLRLLEMDYNRDVLTGHTNFGIHKDDYIFLFNGVPADGTASRGEMRSVILALKFVEAEMLFEDLRRRPLVLLDDVFSELDDTRQKALVKNFQENQVILTSVK
ncbi:DNA replication and repair protein RecF [Candidatus Saccharibacteria bacterium]|nr:DNA replication and repair protein RecF [Candidatus Saccharibacteria bacterium]